jgi:hypothetical protein
MKHVKKFESITDEKFSDYTINWITSPTLSFKIYIPEYIGKHTLDYGGPNDNEIIQKLVKDVKDKLNEIEGVEVEWTPDQSSELRDKYI